MSDHRLVQVELSTLRPALVPLSDEHLELEVELDSDPDVMRYLGNGRPRTREAVDRVHRDRIALATRAPGFGFWVGFVDATFVGWWNLRPQDGPDLAGAGRHGSLGYRLLPRYWRRGLASEGAREVIRYGFQDLGLSRIVAETMAVNVASRATMSSIGMAHVRTFHVGWDEPIPGTEHGEVEYAVTRGEWLA